MKIIEDFSALRYTPDVLARNGVKALVIHSMDGFYNGSISWFKNPEGRGSAHYLISKEGEIRQMVREKDMAWHAGIYDEPLIDYLRPNPNHYTIGIELEDQGKADWKYPEAQQIAAAWLITMLMERYKLTKKNVHLHKELNPSRRSDPQGDFSRTWLFKNLQEESIMPDVADSTQRVEQIIIDGYQALVGEGVRDAEKIWRLETWENTVVFLKSLTGDGRFYKKFILPHLGNHEEELKVAISRANMEKDIFWQSKVESANILTAEAKVKRAEDVLEDSDFSTLFSYTLKKLLSFKKTKGGEA